VCVCVWVTFNLHWLAGLRVSSKSRSVLSYSFHVYVTAARHNFHSVNDRHLNTTVTNVIRRIDSAIDSTLKNLNNPRKVRTPEDLLRLFRFPSRNALQISRAAEVFEQTLDILHKEIGEGYSFNISHKG